MNNLCRNGCQVLCFLPKDGKALHPARKSVPNQEEAYTLACSLETEGQGCWLTVSRTKAPDDPADTARTWVPAPEEECGRLLQFLYENSVQPELWQDVISCWYPQAEQAERLQEGRRVV